MRWSKDPLADHQRAAVGTLLGRLAAFGGAVLADEPGLGKSFVAAEVARLEQTRGTAVEAIVPVSLVGQWVETFRMFGVAASVLTHGESVTAPDPPLRRRLLIVDEAHVFRNPKTRRYQALSWRSAGARVLLVTATPMCNSPSDLEALLRLAVTDDVLLDRGVPSIDVAFRSRDEEAIGVVVGELLVRRDRTVLPPRLAFGDLSREVIWTGGETDEVERMIGSLRFPLVADNGLVRDFLRRRLESSRAALLESLRRQRRFYDRALECLASGRTLPKRDYRRAFGHEEDAAAVQGVLFWELFAPANASTDASEIHGAVAAIDRLRTAVEMLPPDKEKRLLDLCRGTDEPMLIFTGWTATAQAVAEEVRAIRPVAVVTGRSRGNAAAIESFRRGAVHVLVSTDVGAEGLNLQRAGVVVHYDLPWNPSRIDQRNGRAHRIGQERTTVRAVYFLTDRHRAHVFRKVAQKTRTRRRILRPLRLRGESPMCATIRPRIAAEAAVVRYSAARRAGRVLPAVPERRHRAGMELRLEAAASEGAARRGEADLARLVALERWAMSLRP